MASYIIVKGMSSIDVLSIKHQCIGTSLYIQYSFQFLFFFFVFFFWLAACTIKKHMVKESGFLHTRKGLVAHHYSQPCNKNYLYSYIL